MLLLAEILGKLNLQVPLPKVVVDPILIKIFPIIVLPIWAYLPVSVPLTIDGLVVVAVQDNV